MYAIRSYYGISLAKARDGIAGPFNAQGRFQCFERPEGTEPAFAVDVVGTDRNPEQFLEEIIFFVAQLRRTEGRDCGRADFAKLGGDLGQGRIPSRRGLGTAGLAQRLSQSFRRVDVVIASYNFV